MSEERSVVCHFGKHEGKDLADIPSGYLRWCVENIEPEPLPKYRFHEDKTPWTVEEVKEATEKMRDFLSAAEDELLNREQT
jgi:hypothetical protein